MVTVNVLLLVLYQVYKWYVCWWAEFQA